MTPCAKKQVHWMLEFHMREIKGVESLLIVFYFNKLLNYSTRDHNHQVDADWSRFGARQRPRRSGIQDGFISIIENGPFWGICNRYHFFQDVSNSVRRMTQAYPPYGAAVMLNAGENSIT